MSFAFSRKSQSILAAICLVAVVGCSDNNNNNSKPPVVEPPVEPSLTYDAEIVWTEYGIPHVTANDWGSLGYGYAYAYAQQNYCVVMREIVKANGESARYLGDDGDLNEDFVYKLFNTDERMQRIFIDEQPDYVVRLTEGYAAGLNRYLSETGEDALAEGDEGCRGAEWVREVDVLDIAKLLHKTILIGSGGALAGFSTAVKAPKTLVKFEQPANVDQMFATLQRDEFVAGMGMPKSGQIGSNAYAIGEQHAPGSSGVLLGNPHFPWHGNLRFYMSHLTIPGEYDVMGSALAGLPLVVIGFNENVAWSHTVSTGSRFTFYELELNPENLMEYAYDGEMREITSETVSAERPVDGGGVETVEYTFYFSHFGPIVDLGSVSSLLAGWPNAVGTLLTYRDANLDNLRGINQWVKMGQAKDLSEMKTALRDIGIPWVNTIAADRNGDAFYGDISAIPNVTLSQTESCIRGSLQTLLTDFGFLTMDGSDSDCEWGNDPDTPEGVLGYDNLPKLETRAYAANSNDSYWLSNPDMLLEGYSPAIGEERVEQTLRTRQAFVQIEDRLAGTDGLGDPGFNVDNIREVLFGSRSLLGELIVDDVVAICSAVDDWSPYTAGEGIAQTEEACNVLAGWDKTSRVDSVGTHIFWEFWRLFNATENLWAVPFDVTDPVHTPRDLNVGDNAVVEAVKEALVGAVATLSAAGIPADRPWGEIQFDEKNGTRYPIHGASGAMGFSSIYSDLISGEGYADITAGNSYMQAVTWDESDCPDAYAILSYSQSTDPANDNYADSTELYSQSGWIDMPFCEAARDEQEIRRETVQE